MTFNQLLTADPATTDPGVRDPEYPAEHLVTHFLSGGSVVHAVMWIAHGSELKTSVVFPPQAYGGDGLESLIIPLVNAGVNVLTFRPRGMWDGSGEYTLMSAVDDVHAAAEFLRTSAEAGKKTSRGNGYRVDPARIGVVGESGGGGTVGLAAAAENPTIGFVAAFTPANHELHRDLSIIEDHKDSFEFYRNETAGRVDVVKRAKSMTAQDIDRISTISRAADLATKKLLIVGAANDDVTPLADCHYPIVRALREAGATSLTDVIVDDNKSFMNSRITLARLTISWLLAEALI